MKVLYRFAKYWGIRNRLLIAGVVLGTIALIIPIYMDSQLSYITELHLLASSSWKKLDHLNKQAKTTTSNHKPGDNTQAAMIAIQDEQETQMKNAELNDLAFKSSQKAFRIVTIGATVFFVFFVGLMLSLWNTLIPSLSTILNAVKEFKRGNLEHRIHIEGQDETAQLARAFNEMAISLHSQTEKLKELSRLKSDFVSTVSHELRTPLTAIKGSLSLILGGVTGEIPEQTKTMLKITHKNTDRLIRLINDVLDVAKIEAGAIRMRFDKYSLVETVDHAVIGLRSLAESKNITVEWKKPERSPFVVMDRDRVEQVITNLLSNAIKFTEPGGAVKISCEWNTERLMVHIEDTGTGISEENLSLIFEKFQQLESSANKAQEGTGLGLTIAKAIINEHKVQIWVNSEKGIGSTFSFSIPWNGTDFVEVPKDAKKTSSLLAG